MWDVVRSSARTRDIYKPQILHSTGSTVLPLRNFRVQESLHGWLKGLIHLHLEVWNSHSWDGNENFKRPLDRQRKKARWTWKLEQDGIMDYTKIASNYDTPSGLSLQNDHGSGLFSGVSSCFPLYSRLGYSVWTPHFWSQRWAKSHKISHKTCP